LWVVGCGLWVVGCGLWVVSCELWIVSCELSVLSWKGGGTNTNNGQQSACFNCLIFNKAFTILPLTPFTSRS
jgi:hypothetical protein